MQLNKILNSISKLNIRKIILSTKLIDNSDIYELKKGLTSTDIFLLFILFFGTIVFYVLGLKALIYYIGYLVLFYAFYILINEKLYK